MPLVDSSTESADSRRSLADDALSLPEASVGYTQHSTEFCYMEPDAQAMYMFTRRHLMLAVGVVYAVKVKESKT